MTLLIKNLTLIPFCVIFYTKILNIVTSKREKIILFIFTFIFSLWSSLVELHYPVLSTIHLILILSIVFALRWRHNMLLSFVCTLISFSISFACFCISSIPVSIYTLINHTSYDKETTQIIVLLIQSVVVQIPLHSNRLNNSMSLLWKKRNYPPLIIIGSCVVTTSIFLNQGDTLLVKQANFVPIYFYTIFICTISIFLYWRHSLTRTYLEELTKRANEGMNEQLVAMQEQYETLLADKERLSEIVHADKKLVSALEVAVVNRLESTEENPEKDKELLDEIRRFSRERKGSIEITEKYLNPLPSCGIIAIDNVLSYMYQKASPMGIHITVAIDCDVKKTSETLININDFSTLLADMLDNALIATKLNQGKHVLVSFSIVKKHFVVQISDSGIPFTKEVLYKMGKEQITTHANEEGNGIGLMKTFEILNKVNASLFIEEYDQTNGLYTKTLSVAFNGKKQYILYTTRDEMEIAYLYQRPDITVIHK